MLILEKMGTAVDWAEWFILRSHYFYCQNKNTDSLFVYFEETFQLLSISSLKSNGELTAKGY